MLPVKTLCHCGGAGVMLKIRLRGYAVACRKCGFTSGAWETMTVALIDWESAVRAHSHKKRET